MTDDTSFRMELLQRWLADEPGDLDEDAFIAWLRTVATPTRGGGGGGGGPGGAGRQEPGWLNESRRAQAEDWLVMYAAEAAGVAGGPFFKPDAPVCFGLFMFIELAAVHAGASPASVQAHFRSVTRLDKKSAGPAVGDRLQHSARPPLPTAVGVPIGTGCQHIDRTLAERLGWADHWDGRRPLRSGGGPAAGRGRAG